MNEMKAKKRLTALIDGSKFNHRNTFGSNDDVTRRLYLVVTSPAVVQ